MGTLYKDMSRIAPAPTLARETASFIANSVVVVAFFAVVIFALDGSPALNGGLAGAVVGLLFTRWLYVALTRRDGGPSRA